MTVSQNATPESDTTIQLREWQKGRVAAEQGQTMSDCPWIGGLTKQWWTDGFLNKNYPVGMIRAQ